VPEGIHKANRAPSYRAIALAILKNDHNLYSLGYSQRDSAILDEILRMKKKTADKQMGLFD
jgi:predicted phosphoadenosine phosphosulfate sulfurtransferase